MLLCQRRRGEEEVQKQEREKRTKTQTSLKWKHVEHLQYGDSLISLFPSHTHTDTDRHTHTQTQTQTQPDANFKQRQADYLGGAIGVHLDHILSPLFDFELNVVLPLEG